MYKPISLCKVKYSIYGTKLQSFKVKLSPFIHYKDGCRECI